MNPSDDENRRAKLEMIQAYFESEIDGLEKRVAFLQELVDCGRIKEARLLVVCYIEGIANYLYGGEGQSRRNFVRVLEEHGADDFLQRIHPQHLTDELLQKILPQLPKALQECLPEKLELALGAVTNELCSKQQIEKHLSAHFQDPDLERVRPELWRGTVASIAYEWFRSKAVHRLGAVPVVMSQTNLDGHPAPRIDFAQLYPPLQRIVEASKALSLETGKWFGKD